MIAPEREYYFETQFSKEYKNRLSLDERLNIQLLPKDYDKGMVIWSDGGKTEPEIPIVNAKEAIKIMKYHLANI